MSKNPVDDFRPYRHLAKNHFTYTQQYLCAKCGYPRSVHPGHGCTAFCEAEKLNFYYCKGDGFHAVIEEFSEEKAVEHFLYIMNQILKPEKGISKKDVLCEPVNVFPHEEDGTRLKKIGYAQAQVAYYKNAAEQSVQRTGLWRCKNCGFESGVEYSVCVKCKSPRR